MSAAAGHPAYQVLDPGPSLPEAHSSPTEQNYKLPVRAQASQSMGTGASCLPPQYLFKQEAEKADHFEDRSEWAEKLPKEGLPLGGQEGLCPRLFCPFCASPMKAAYITPA